MICCCCCCYFDKIKQSQYIEYIYSQILAKVMTLDDANKPLLNALLQTPWPSLCDPLHPLLCLHSHIIIPYFILFSYVF